MTNCEDQLKLYFVRRSGGGEEYSVRESRVGYTARCVTDAIVAWSELRDHDAEETTVGASGSGAGSVC